MNKPAGWMDEDDYFKRLQTYPTCYCELVDLYVPVVGNTEILLEQRAADDPFYAQQFCTLGSTIMMRETLAEFWQRHAERESGIAVDAENAPQWQFCGLMTAPKAVRHHSSDMVFVRCWQKKPTTQSEVVWYRVDELETLDIVPSIKEVIHLALAVGIHGEPPAFREFLGKV